MTGFSNVEQSLASLASRTFWGQRLEINIGNAMLAANLHLPPQQLLSRNAEERYPVVIMLHGLGSNRHEASGNFIKAAATFALRNMVVLRFDFRGCGETGGSSLNISLAKQIEDTGYVIDFVRQDLSRMSDLIPLNLDRIALLGLSMGGLTAAAILGRRIDVYAAVLWEPPFDLMQTMNHVFGPLSISKIRSHGYFQAGTLQLGPDFFACLENFSVAREVRSFNGPLLIVHGKKDQIVPVETVQSWVDALRNADLQVFLIEGADHAFTQDRWAWQAIAQTALWLEDKLQAPRPIDGAFS